MQTFCMIMSYNVDFIFKIIDWFLLQKSISENFKYLMFVHIEQVHFYDWLIRGHNQSFRILNLKLMCFLFIKVPKIFTE